MDKVVHSIKFVFVSLLISIFVDVQSGYGESSPISRDVTAFQQKFIGHWFSDDPEEKGLRRFILRWRILSETLLC